MTIPRDTDDATAVAVYLIRAGHGTLAPTEDWRDVAVAFFKRPDVLDCEIEAVRRACDAAYSRIRQVAVDPAAIPPAWRDVWSHLALTHR